MNHIYFMFNKIYGYSKIHEKGTKQEDLFSNVISLECDCTQDYCESVVNDVI